MDAPRILHVDDDQGSLQQAKVYLEGEGIGGWGMPSVVGVAEFDEAMAMLEAHRFDLVILDVRLGGYEAADVAPEGEAGVQVLDQIEAHRFVPIVFWTGLPELVRGLETPFIRVLEKTQGLDVLALTVKEVFDSETSPRPRAFLQEFVDVSLVKKSKRSPKSQLR